MRSEEIKHSALRRRLLEGGWRPDLVKAIRKEVGSDRAPHWGLPDMTKNTYRAVVTQLAITYDRPPILQHEDAAAVAFMEGLLREAGLWSMAPRLQRLLIGQRETAYCIKAIEEDGTTRLMVRVVPADLILDAEAEPDEPDVPVRFRELRERPTWKKGETGDVWTIDDWSVRDGRVWHRVTSEDGETDLTEHYLGARFEGESYPYHDAAGRPVLPYVLYHAERTGRLFDPYEGIELVEGSLRCAVLWTFWCHLVRDASWPQRYVVNARLDGGEDDASTGQSFVPADPTMVAVFRSMIPGVGPQVGQWAPGGDPMELGEAIRSYQADLAVDFGISPSDIQRATGDARSGYAIWLTNEGIRSAQRKMEPQLLRGDRAMLRTVAAVYNSTSGSAVLPEAGWDIAYRGLPLSIEEKRAVIGEYEKRVALGVMSPVQLLANLEQITEDQARARLDQIQDDVRKYRAVA